MQHKRDMDQDMNNIHSLRPQRPDQFGTEDISMSKNVDTTQKHQKHGHEAHGTHSMYTEQRPDKERVRQRGIYNQDIR